MAKQDFRYVINTELKLNTASLNQLIQDAKIVDKAIRRYFEQNEGIQLKVGINRGLAYRTLQQEVRQIVDGYNRGQVPHIKIPIKIDPRSISTMRSEISAVKSQLNSLVEQTRNIHVNVKVDADTQALSQLFTRLQGEKPTLGVSLHVDKQDIERLQEELNKIKTAVNVHINAQPSPQTNDRGLPRVGTRGRGQQGTQEAPTRQPSAISQLDRELQEQFYRARIAKMEAEAYERRVRAEERIIRRNTKGRQNQAYVHLENINHLKDTIANYKKYQSELKKLANDIERVNNYISSGGGKRIQVNKQPIKTVDDAKQILDSLKARKQELDSILSKTLDEYKAMVSEEIKQMSNYVPAGYATKLQNTHPVMQKIIQNKLVSVPSRRVFEDLDRKLVDPNLSNAERRRAYQQILELGRQAAVRDGRNYVRTFTMLERSADGLITRFRTMTVEFDKFGNVVERGSHNISEMFRRIGTNLFFYGALTSGFFAITNAIQNSIEVMSEFEQQLLRIETLSMDFGNGAAGRLKQGMEQFTRQNVINDAFQFSSKYGFDINSVVLPAIQSIMVRSDIIGEMQKNGRIVNNREVADKIMKQILDFSIMAYGPTLTEDQIRSVTANMLSLYANTKINPVTRRPYTPNEQVRQINDFIDYLATIEEKTLRSEAVLDVVGILAPDALQKGFSAKYLAAMTGAYVSKNQSATSDEIETTMKTIMAALSNPSNYTEQALNILGIDPYTGGKDGKAMTPQEILEAIVPKYRKLMEEGQYALIEQVTRGLSTTGSGKGSKENQAKIKMLLDAMSEENGVFSQLMSLESSQYRGKTAQIVQRQLESLGTTVKRAGQNVKELVINLGRLGAIDGLKVLISTFNTFLTLLNKALNAVAGFGEKIKELTSFGDFEGFNPVSLASQVLMLAGFVKTIKFIMNTFADREIVGHIRAFASRAVASPNPMASPKTASIGASVGNAVIAGLTGAVSTSGYITTNSGKSYRVGYVNPQLGSVITSKDLTLNRGAQNSFTRYRTNSSNSVLGTIGYGIGFIGGELVGRVREKVWTSGATSTGRTAANAGRNLGNNILNMLRSGQGVLKGFLFTLGRLSVVTGILTAAFFGLKFVVDKVKEHNEREIRERAQKQKEATKTKEDFERTKALLDRFKELDNKSRQGKITEKESRELEKVRNDLKARGIETNMSTPERRNYPSYAVSASDMNKQDQRSYPAYAVSASYLVPSPATISYIVDKKPRTIKADDEKQYKKMIEDLRRQGVSEQKAREEAIKKSDRDLRKYDATLYNTQKVVKEADRLMNITRYRSTLNSMKFMGAENSVGYASGEIYNIMEYLTRSDAMMQKVQANADKARNAKAEIEKSMAEAREELVKKLGRKAVEEIDKEASISALSGDMTEFREKYKNTDAWQYVLRITEMHKMEEVVEQLTDAEEQLRLARLQEQATLKNLRAQLIVASTGFEVIGAKIRAVQVAVGRAQAMITMAETDEEKQSAAKQAISGISKQLLGYQNQLANIELAMENLKKQNPSLDFSLDTLYNPGAEGLTEAQLAYKQLLDLYYETQSNITDTNLALHEQLETLKNLVLNSDKYANVWERVQNRINLARDITKELYNVGLERSLINNFASVRSMLTGKSEAEYKTSKYQELRDKGIEIYEKAMLALQNYKDDEEKLKQAFKEITEGTTYEFTKNVVNPFGEIVSNQFAPAANVIAQSANVFSEASANFGNALQSFVVQVNNVLAQNTQSFIEAMSIPSFSVSGDKGTGGKDPSSLSTDELIRAYIQQNYGYKVGSKEYGTIAKMLRESMTRDELIKELRKSTVATQSNSAVYQYASTIDKYLGGRLAGYGSVFVKYGAQYGVDPRLMAAIAMHETGNGTSNAIKNKNNVGGIMGKGGLRSYSSLEEGIADLARVLRQVYFDKGINTIPGIGAKYAPPSGKPNDPNNYWVKGVASFYSRMTGIPVEQLTGGQKTTYTPSMVGALSGWSGKITSGYGWRTDPFTGKKAFHRGIDIAGAEGTPLQANVSGTVVAAGSYGYGTGYGGYGNVVAIKDAQGLTHVFAHLSKVLVKVGQQISAGQQIGAIGKTGRATGPHLHYEVRKGGYGTDIDPTSYLNAARSTTASYSLSLGQKEVKEQEDAAKKLLQSAIQGLIEAVQARVEETSPKLIQEQFSYDRELTFLVGKARDITGTSARLNFFDMVTSYREDLLTKIYENGQALKEYQETRKSYAQKANAALAAGDKDTYNIYQQGIKKLDELIKQLQSNNEELKKLQQGLAEMQKEDPRFNATNASMFIDAGYGKLRELNSYRQQGSADYYRLLNEINTMYAEYLTTDKQVAMLQEVWSRSGINTVYYNIMRRIADRENLDLIYRKAKDITNTLRVFAESTHDWYVTLEDALAVYEELRAVEEKRLENAKKMFEYYGTNLNAYVSQRAEINVRDRGQTKDNLQNALNLYKYGFTRKPYYMRTGTYETRAQVQEVADYLQKEYGLKSYINQTKGGLYYLETEQSMSKDMVKKLISDLQAKRMLAVAYTLGGEEVYAREPFYVRTGTFQTQKEAERIVDILQKDYGTQASVKQTNAGLYYVETEKELSRTAADSVIEQLKKRGLVRIAYRLGGDRDYLDENERMANLQIIADMYRQLTDQMNEYRRAVVDAYKAGAMSLREYMKELDKLRDLQSEARESALQIVDNLSNAFHQSLSQALAAGMTGKFNSSQDFIDSMKQELANTISSQMANVILKNSGMQDRVEAFIAKFATLLTEGKTSDIINMFNNNKNLGEYIEKALAPFKPLIEQIVASTEGIFSIMKDQVYNAPQGFKIDSYMYEIAKGKGLDEMRRWYGSDLRNEAGSPIGNNGGSGYISIGEILDQYREKRKRTKTWLNFRSTPSYGDNIIGVLPPNTEVIYLGMENGWAKVKYKGKVGYVGPQYIYHSGGIAGIMNFASPNGLKPNEISAIMKVGEVALQPPQLAQLLAPKTTGDYNGDININIDVNINGNSNYSKSEIENVVEVAVARALREFRQEMKNTSLNWRGRVN